MIEKPVLELKNNIKKYIITLVNKCSCYMETLRMVYLAFWIFDFATKIRKTHSIFRNLNALLFANLPNVQKQKTRASL